MEPARPAGVITELAKLPVLTIVTGDQPYEAHPLNGPVVIGREPPADIIITDQWISATHLRVEPQHDRWIGIDLSRNGVFHHGVREHAITITDGLSLQLGHADGVTVRFELADVNNPESSTTFYATGETDDDGANIDPNTLRAGQAVAARRRELNLSQRQLAQKKIINAGALIAFEKGRSRPRTGTQNKLEAILGWPLGQIEALIRESGPAPADDSAETDAAEDYERTDLIGGTTTVESKYMAEAVKVALGMVRTSIDLLPPPTDPDYNPKVNNILNQVRKLEGVAANASRGVTGSAEVVLVLSQARQIYRDLMLRAATSPNATIGQRLFAGRQRAELTEDEAASAAGVPVETIRAAEAGALLNDADNAAIAHLVTILAG